MIPSMMNFSTCTPPRPIVCYSNISLVFDNSNTVNFDGQGTLQNPIKAHVNVSGDSGNVLTIRQNGLYVSPSTDFNFFTQNTQSIILNGDGKQSTPLIADVLISQRPDNAIFLNDDGIFAFAQAPFAGIITQNSSTVTFVGNGTIESPLIATAAGGGGTCDCNSFEMNLSVNSGITDPDNKVINVRYSLTRGPGTSSDFVAILGNNGEQFTPSFSPIFQRTLPEYQPTTAHLYADIFYTIPQYTSNLGAAYDFIFLANGLLIKAWSLTQFTPGQTGVWDDAFLGPLPPTGKYELFVTPNAFDTNGPSAQQGVLAIGGDYNPRASFTTTFRIVDTDGNFMLNSSNNFPVITGENYIEVPFKTHIYSIQAQNGTITINGFNGGATAIKVEFVASTTSSLSFTETVAPNNSYNKTIPLTVADMDANDFVLRFLKP